MSKTSKKKKMETPPPQKIDYKDAYTFSRTLLICVLICGLYMSTLGELSVTFYICLAVVVCGLVASLLIQKLLVRCPWCGKPLDLRKGIPENCNHCNKKLF